MQRLVRTAYIPTRGEPPFEPTLVILAGLAVYCGGGGHIVAIVPLESLQVSTVLYPYRSKVLDDDLRDIRGNR